MNQSEHINELTSAMVKVQAVVKNPPRDAKGHNHNYANLADVMEAIREPLTANGLAYFQTTKETDDNKVCVITTLAHTSGQYIQGELTLPFDKKGGPQGAGSALTYARRYSLAAMVGIYQEDDDGTKGQGGKTFPQQQSKKPAQPTRDQIDLVQKIKVSCEYFGWDAKAYAAHNKITPLSPVEELKRHDKELADMIARQAAGNLSEADQYAIEEYAA